MQTGHKKVKNWFYGSWPICLMIYWLPEEGVVIQGDKGLNNTLTQNARTWEQVEFNLKGITQYQMMESSEKIIFWVLKYSLTLQIAFVITL